MLYENLHALTNIMTAGVGIAFTVFLVRKAIKWSRLNVE
jgi:hypothetical protein